MQSSSGKPFGRTTRRQAIAGALGLVALSRRAEAAHVVRPWPSARPTPELSLIDIDGRSWTLDALRGRPVLLNFWATWCEPCRAEMPSLERLQTRHDPSRLAVVSVNYKEPAPKIRRFLEAMPFSLPILLDPEGETTGTWTPRVFPTTVLIDRGGTARQSVIGELDWLGDTARALIDPYLARTA